MAAPAESSGLELRSSPSSASPPADVVADEEEEGDQEEDYATSENEGSTQS